MVEFNERFNVDSRILWLGQVCKIRDLTRWNTFHTWPRPQQSLSPRCRALNVRIYESSVEPSRPRVSSSLSCCCFFSSWLIFQSRISIQRVPEVNESFAHQNALIIPQYILQVHDPHGSLYCRICLCPSHSRHPQ